jgi:hypothetical protein
MINNMLFILLHSILKWTSIFYNHHVVASASAEVRWAETEGNDIANLHFFRLFQIRIGIFLVC